MFLLKQNHAVNHVSRISLPLTRERGWKRCRDACCLSFPVLPVGHFYTFSCIFFPPIIFFNFSNLKGIICPSKLCNKKYRLPYSFTSKRPSYLFTSSIDWETIPCLRMRTYFLCLPSSAVRLCHIYLLPHGQRFDIPTKIPRSRL